jgi:hypothetical protein
MRMDASPAKKFEVHLTNNILVSLTDSLLLNFRHFSRKDQLTRMASNLTQKII